MTKARDLANASTALSAVTATELGYVDGVTSAIQTQIDAKAPSSTAVTLTGTQTLTNKTLTNPVISSVINNTLTSTTGDIIYASGANTPARLGIGSSAQVLTVSGGIPAWATPSAGGMTLISTTTLTGTTVTLNSFSGYTDLQLVIIGAYGSNQNTFRARFNSDTGANYYEGQYANGANAGAATSLIMGDGTSSSSTNVNQRNFSVLKIQRYAQTHGKPFQVQSGYIYWSSNATNYVTTSNSIYAATSAITSIDLYMASGNFSGGTAYLYGVK
jgi:hypothetical protein